MKRLLVFVVLFTSINAAAQFDTLTVKQHIRTAMDSMSAAFKNANWHVMARYTNKNLVNFMGGTEGYVRLVDTMMSNVLKEGRIDEYQAGNILQLVKTPDGYQCVAESFLQMTVSDIMVTGCSYNIGTSPDGRDWRFLRLEENTALDVKDFIPNLSPKLKLPIGQMVPGITLNEFKKTYTIRYRKTKAPVKKAAPAKKPGPKTKKVK